MAKWPHRKVKRILKRLDDGWNLPDRSDHYMMQLTSVVESFRQTFSEHELKWLSPDLKIRFNLNEIQDLSSSELEDLSEEKAEEYSRQVIGLFGAVVTNEPVEIEYTSEED